MKEDIKSLLRGYKYIMPDVRELNENLNGYLESTVKAVTISDMPRANTNNISDPVGDLIARYGDDISSLVSKINELLDKKQLIENMLVCLSSVERRIITYRYIDRPEQAGDIYTWIAGRIGYERRQVIRIHNTALVKLALNVT